MDDEKNVRCDVFRLGHPPRKLVAGMPNAETKDLLGVCSKTDPSEYFLPLAFQPRIASSFVNQWVATIL